MAATNRPATPEEAATEAIAASRLTSLCEALRLMGATTAEYQRGLEELKKMVQEMMDRTYKKKWTRDRRRKARRKSEAEITPTGFKVTSVRLVDNAVQRQRFDAAGARMAPTMPQPPAADPPLSVRTQRWSGGLQTNKNEMLLLHGTSSLTAAEAIAVHGFDLKLANPHGMFGPQCYLAESSTKADEYASPEDENADRVMMICRVFVGNYLYTDKDMKDNDLRAEMQSLLSSGRFDSIINDREHIPKIETYKEFVVPKPEQILPEVIVTYKQILAETAN